MPPRGAGSATIDKTILVMHFTVAVVYKLPALTSASADRRCVIDVPPYFTSRKKGHLVNLTTSLIEHYSLEQIVSD